MFAVATTGRGGRHLAEIGLLLGFLGASIVAIGAYWVLRGARRSDQAIGRAIERAATLIGFALIGVGLAMQLVVQAGRHFR